MLWLVSKQIAAARNCTEVSIEHAKSLSLHTQVVTLFCQFTFSSTHNLIQLYPFPSRPDDLFYTVQFVTDAVD